MSEVQTPPWLEGWKPTPVAEKPVRSPGNPNWIKGGPSPHPQGRTPGLPDKRLLATAQMLDEMRGIVSMLVERALAGDVNAASVVLAKVMPSLKAQAEKVQFDFDATAPVSAQVAQVLDALAGGLLSADVARLIIESIKALSDVRASEELAARIEALEEARLS